jgi:hypothetical protein
VTVFKRSFPRNVGILAAKTSGDSHYLELVMLMAVFGIIPTVRNQNYVTAEI